MNKLEEIKAMVAKATAPDTQSPIVFDDWGDSRGQDISEEVALLLAVADAAADVVAWHGTVQDLFRKEARGDEVSVSDMSRANSEWSDAMDRLSAALAVEEAQ